MAAGDAGIELAGKDIIHILVIVISNNCMYVYIYICNYIITYINKDVLELGAGTAALPSIVAEI